MNRSSETIQGSQLDLNAKKMTNDVMISGSHKVVVSIKGKENKRTNPKHQGERRIKRVILDRGAGQWKAH